MNRYPTMPDLQTIEQDALNTTMRPVSMVPKVIAYGYDVVANTTHLMRGIDAGAVYLIPPFSRPHRTPKPGQLVAVTGRVRLVDGRRVVDWCEGLVGEIEGMDG